MVTLGYYNDSYYFQLVALLQSCDLYDEPWETRENLKRKIERDPESIIIALDEDALVGCVFVVVDGWIGMVWRLSVLSTYRKQGIGRQLMEKSEAIIKQRGVKEACLFVGHTKDDLKKWYTKQGYTQTSDYTFMYKEINN